LRYALSPRGGGERLGTARRRSMKSPPCATRVLAIRWESRFVIVPLASIVRIEACDDRVRVVADRTYPHRETLAGLCTRLPTETFLRVHRSHVVYIDAVREVRLRHHGEYALVLRDGSSVVSGRNYRAEVEATFGLLPSRSVA
jgi:two-component system, LytTR family, response regulator